MRADVCGAGKIVSRLSSMVMEDFWEAAEVSFLLTGDSLRLYEFYLLAFHCIVQYRILFIAFIGSAVTIMTFTTYTHLYKSYIFTFPKGFYEQNHTSVYYSRYTNQSF